MGGGRNRREEAEEVSGDDGRGREFGRIGDGEVGGDDVDTAGGQAGKIVGGEEEEEQKEEEKEDAKEKVEAHVEEEKTAQSQ